MPVRGSDEKYYSAAEVAKIKGIKRQSVIDGCKRGQYPGAYKTEPDSFNTQGVWKIPVSALDTPVVTKDVVEVSRQISPVELREVFKEVVREEVEPLREEVRELRGLLEAHYRQVDGKLREAVQEKKPWYKRLF